MAGSTSQAPHAGTHAPAQCRSLHAALKASEVGRSMRLYTCKGAREMHVVMVSLYTSIFGLPTLTGDWLQCGEFNMSNQVCQGSGKPPFNWELHGDHIEFKWPKHVSLKAVLTSCNLKHGTCISMREEPERASVFREGREGW
jgi:hypothetical protein